MYRAMLLEVEFWEFLEILSTYLCLHGRTLLCGQLSVQAFGFIGFRALISRSSASNPCISNWSLWGIKTALNLVALTLCQHLSSKYSLLHVMM